MMEKVQQARRAFIRAPKLKPFLEFAKISRRFRIRRDSSLVFGLVAFLILGGVGGAISAALCGESGNRS